MTTALTTPGPAALAAPETPTNTRLADALMVACAACKPVAHDSRNTHHGYNYTSSEAIITEARAALASAGLALIPLETTLNGWDRQGENRFELERKFLLVHSSGERYPVVIRWPVCPEKGRPLDKAVAIADTTSLAYYLRDLLLMARCDPSDDVAARDDRPRPQQQRPDASIGQKLERRVRAKESELVAAGLCAPGALLAEVLAWGGKAGHPAPLSAWPREAVAAVGELVKAFEAACRAEDVDAPEGGGDADEGPEAGELIGPAELAALDRMMAEAERTWPRCRAFLALPADANPADLSHGQYRTLMQRLEQSAAGRAAKTAAEPGQ